MQTRPDNSLSVAADQQGCAYDRAQRGFILGRAYCTRYVAHLIDSTHFPSLLSICLGALNRTFSKQTGHSTHTAHWCPGGRGGRSRHKHLVGAGSATRCHLGRRLSTVTWSLLPCPVAGRTSPQELITGHRSQVVVGVQPVLA